MDLISGKVCSMRGHGRKSSWNTGFSSRGILKICPDLFIREKREKNGKALFSQDISGEADVVGKAFTFLNEDVAPGP